MKQHPVFSLILLVCANLILAQPVVAQSEASQVAADTRGLRPIRSAAHALIVSVSDYRQGMPSLPGVAHDAKHAVSMARALGVPEANIQVLTHDTTGLADLRAGLDALATRMKANDEVFFYFSGYATHRFNTETGTRSCVAGLLAGDGALLPDDELEQRLQRIAMQSKRLLVFVDAAGIDQPELTSKQASTRYRNKFWSEPGAEACILSANLPTQNFEGKTANSGARNLIHIAAARVGETAFDDALRGGIASLAWSNCLNGGAVDLDGSMGVSVRELQTCAQDWMDADFGRQKSHSSGNLESVLINTAKHPEKVVAAAVLKDIYANRDIRRQVRVVADKPVYQARRDRLRFSLTSSHAGYVYVLLTGSDGKQFDLLFPNQKDQRNLIRANETWNLPRTGWSLRAGGPAGENHLLVMVSDTPRNFADLGMRAAGLFSALSVTPFNARALQVLATGEAQSQAKPACALTSEARTAVIAGSCSEAYGADLIPLREID